MLGFQISYILYKTAKDYQNNLILGYCHRSTYELKPDLKRDCLDVYGQVLKGDSSLSMLISRTSKSTRKTEKRQLTETEGTTKRIIPDLEIRLKKN